MKPKAHIRRTSPRRKPGPSLDSGFRRNDGGSGDRPRTLAGPGPEKVRGRPRFKQLAIAAARLADSKKAEEVAVYDMDGRSALADFVVVATVDNPAQLDAVDEEISRNLKQEGLFALYRDGMRSKNWKVLDYGGIIVHSSSARPGNSILSTRYIPGTAK